MKIIDRNTKEVIADIIGGENMTMDEVLDLMRYSVTDEGQIHDDNNDQDLNAWYDDLEMVL